MDNIPGIYLKKVFWLLIGVVALQTTAIGLMIYTERGNVQRHQVIDQRTSTMVDDIFPELFQDLSAVSRKASDIKQGVHDLKTQVAAVDRHVGEVGGAVSDVGNQVDGVAQNVNNFVQNRSWFLWGHSLNPYVLVTLLLSVAALIPISAWWFGKGRGGTEPQLDELSDSGSFQNFSLRLDRLYRLLQKIRAAEDSKAATGTELRKLVEETERLIEETRAELALMSYTTSSTKASTSTQESNPDILH